MTKNYYFCKSILTLIGKLLGKGFWKTHPETGLTHDWKIEISKKLDEFSRNWSDPDNRNFENKNGFPGFANKG